MSKASDDRWDACEALTQALADDFFALPWWKRYWFYLTGEYRWWLW